MKAPISSQMVLSEAASNAETFAPPRDFSAIYRDHFGSVLVWLRALGVPEADVEDVAQEAFLVVRRKLSQFREGNLAGWLYRIAQRTASDHRRRAWFRRWFTRAPEATLATLPDAAPTPAAALEARQAHAALSALLDELNEDMRVVFWLFEIEEWSAKEIADVLGVPPTTVFMRLHHARGLLKKKIERRRRREGAQ